MSSNNISRLLMNVYRCSTILRNAVYIVAVFLFLSSCSSPKEKVARVYTVEIQQMQFQPKNISVNKGDTVIFINKDIVAHDVTEKNKAWASPILSPGDSWKLVATERVDYFCSIHLVMTGKVTVQ